MNKIKNKKRKKELNSTDRPLDYQILFEAANDALFLLNENMAVVDVNTAACKRLGYNKEELLGMPLTQIDSPRSTVDVPDIVNRIMHEGFAVYESIHLTREGKDIPVEISVKKIEKDGRLYFFSIARDISDREQSERLLVEQELTYKAVVETSVDGFWVTDLEGQFLDVNDKYIKMSGYSREEFLQMSISDIDAMENPDETKEHILKVLNEGYDRFETRHRKKNGDLWSVEVVTSFWSTGPGRLIVFIIDITERKEAEKKILDMAMFPSQNPNPVLRITDTGRILFSNNSSKELIEIWEKSIKTSLPAELLECASIALRDKREYNIELLVNNHYYLFCVAPVIDKAYLNIYGMDITDKIKSQEKIQALSLAITHSPVSVMITDLKGRITYVNPKFTQVSGYSEEEVLGKNPRILKSGRQSKDFYRNLWDTICSGKEWKGQFSNRSKSGKEYWESASISAILDIEGKPVSYIAVKEDITEKKLKEERIHFLAMHDALTHLYNRASFMDHLSQILHMDERKGTSTTLLYLDLNGFKGINDSFGHHAGDELLKKVAHDLVSSIRQMDVAARLGGDEFAVILPDTNEKEHIETIVRRIIKKINKPLVIRSHQCMVGVSIGISTFPDGNMPLEDFLICADRAMYSAKEKGNNVFVYCSDL